MLKKEGKINDAIIENMLSWRHKGFSVHIGARIWPEDENALGNLAKYIIRASFSQERMLYISAEKSADGVAKVVCTSKDGKTEQSFDALDWLARIVVHIPNKYEQLVRYVLYYSNKSNGMRKKAETDDAIPSIAPGEPKSKQFRRSRAMPIQKIYEVDPLCCPNCQNQMRIVSILEAGPPVKKILEHLDLWDTRNHDPPNEDLSHILRTRLRRFGLPNPAIRLLGLSPSLSEKKIETGIGAGLRLETGRFPCFSRFFRLPQTMFNSSAIFAHSSSDSTTARPPAPALRRNMLRRRAGAGGRETIEKSGVVSLTKGEFLSFPLDRLVSLSQCFYVFLRVTSTI